MPSPVPFWIAFVTTVVLLIVAAATGFSKKRKIHLWAGPATIVALGLAIWQVEKLSRNYSFPPEVLSFHLIFAKAGGLLALPVVATGIWLSRSERARRFHRAAVILWLVVVLIATGTGLYMFGLGTPKAG